jgi:iron(III) transport system ATP-binding protein
MFAAEFMGSNNRLTGKVAEVRGAMAKITNGDWALSGQLRSDRRAGDAATAVIRIEKTRLRDAPTESSLPAKVITALYLGERWDYLMDVGGQRVRVWAPAAPAQRPYWVEFPPESLWIF